VPAEVAATERRVFLRAEQPALEGRRVLVVDDNDVNRDILARLADRWGMPHTAVASGPAALAAAAEAEAAGRPFDLVLLDVQMPEMDGVETAHSLRAVLDAPPLVVMLTSINRDGALRERARNAGVHAVLYKPTKPAVLHDALVQAFGEHKEAAPAAPLCSAVPAAPTRSPGEAGPRVLLAEDNGVNQKVALRLLDRLGVAADVVADGAAAVEAVQAQSEAGQPYDLVLMDVQMPVLDGLAATRQIRALGEAVHQPRVVALTANAMDGDRQRCLDAGCDGYLAKPVRRDELAHALFDGAAPTHPRSGPITQLVYASSAVRDLTAEALAEVLQVSRRNNAAVGVTGVLLYAGGNVMQALEGPPEAVEATFERIRRDPRHRDVSVIYRGEADVRAFPDWSMGLKCPDDLPGDLPAGLRDAIRAQFDGAGAGASRPERLLSTFRMVAT